jgi:Tfp pilus assembly protein PilF
MKRPTVALPLTHVPTGRVGRWFVAVCVLVAATGCATAPRPLDASVFDDARYQPLPRVDPAEAMRVSDAMRAFVTRDLAPLVRRHGAQAALGMVMQRRGWIEVEYDDSRTRTAAQAFDARAGNCMSLVMLTGALARELGLQVYFQEALASQQWSRRAGLHVASGHVNVTLVKPRWKSLGVSWDSSAALTIDFMPSAEAARQRTRLVGEDRLLAMYANNRAVESLADRRLPLAYAWARAALQRDPTYLGAANTLAVIDHAGGHHAAAERALREVLAREHDNTRALSNLVAVLHAQGRTREADDTAARLAALEPDRPFEYFELGLQALAAGEATTARALFLKELARDPDYHEFHFGLAQAEARLGNTAAARRHLERAAELSPESGTRARYAAKVERLRALVRIE